jgi:hypothetical protein
MPRIIKRLNTSLLRRLQFSKIKNIIFQHFDQEYFCNINILDFGAGRCFLANDLLQSGFRLSIVEPQKKLAKKYFAGDKNDIFEDINELPKLMKYDVIVVSSVLQCIDDPEATLKNIKKYMHEDTLLMISVPNKYQSLFLKKHRNNIWEKMGGVNGVGAYEPDELRELLINNKLNVVSTAYVPSKVSSLLWELSIAIWYKTGLSYNIIFWGFYPVIVAENLFSTTTKNGSEYICVAKKAVKNG